MNVHLTGITDLTNREWEAWVTFQKGTPFFDSPFYAPEFAQAVHLARGDVEIAVLREGNESVGFFPFHRNRWNMGSPVGKHLSDFQGVILRDGVTWDARDLVAACGLRSLDFDQLPVSQAPFQAYRWRVEEAPYVDLSRGYEAYETEHRRAGSSIFAQIHRKARKIEREVGPLRFEWHTADAIVFETLLDWKREQRMRARMGDAFPPWAVDLLDRVRHTQGVNFGGLLSALYVGDALLAAHLGLCNEAALHIWFPAYSPAYAKYSPGLILLLHLAEACGSRAIRRIDMGKGDERYKRRLMTDSVALAEGWVNAGNLAGAVPGAWYRARRMARSGPLSTPYTIAKRALRGLRCRVTAGRASAGP